MKIGSLGDIVFEVSSDFVRTPNDFQRSVSARFETHYVQGAKPRLEYLSEELDSFSMSIRLVEMGGVDPELDFERLANLCRNGVVVPFMLAGVRFGNVVIEKCTEKWRGKGEFGPFCIDVALELKEYV